MAFDPITFSAVVNSMAPIGSLERVVSSFDDPKYLAGNQVFNMDDYPELGSQIPGGFHGELWEKKAIIDLPSDLSTSTAVIGGLLHSWKSGSNYYFLTSTTTPYATNLYKTASATLTGAITLVKSLPFPATMTAIQVSMVGDLMYMSFADKSYVVYNLVNDPELNTPDKRTMPATAQASPYFFATGAGITVAMAGSMGASATAGAAFKSTDGGLTWAAPTTVTGLHPTSGANGFIYANGVFVATAGSTAQGNYAYSANGTTWAGGLMTPATTRSGLVFDPVRSVFMAFPNAAGGVILESPTGATWTVNGTCPVANNSYRSVQITSNNVIVCGLGSGNLNAIATTTDGTTFTTYTHATDVNSSFNVSSALVGNNIIKFSSGANGSINWNTAVGSSIATWTSPIALTKTRVTSFSTYYKGNIILMMDGMFPTIATTTTSTWNGLVSSDNGSTWQPMVISSGADVVSWGGITATPTGFFAAGKVSYQGTGGNFVFAKSTDGINWTYVNTAGTPAAVSYINSVTCNKSGVIVIATNNSGNNMLRSANNGDSWTKSDALLSSNSAGLVLAVDDKFIFVTNNASALAIGNTKWSTDGTAWATPTVLPTSPVSLPVASAVGVQQINTIAICVMARVSGASINTYPKDIMYTLNGGATWAFSALPAVASQSSPIGVAIVNGVVIVPLVNGYILRSTDITNSNLWEISTVQSTSGDITGYNFGSMFGNSSNDNVIMFAPQTLAENFIVRGLTTANSFRRIPYMPSDVPNTKWVIKAK